MNCVNQQTGQVNFLQIYLFHFFKKLQKVIREQLSLLNNWNSSYGMEQILVELRNQMGTSANKKLSQPAEGSTYH